jgi:hypothetical protein
MIVDFALREEGDISEFCEASLQPRRFRWGQHFDIAAGSI